MKKTLFAFAAVLALAPVAFALAAEAPAPTDLAAPAAVEAPAVNLAFALAEAPAMTPWDPQEISTDELKDLLSPARMRCEPWECPCPPGFKCKLGCCI